MIGLVRLVGRVVPAVADAAAVAQLVGREQHLGGDHGRGHALQVGDHRHHVVLVVRHRTDVVAQVGHCRAAPVRVDRVGVRGAADQAVGG